MTENERKLMLEMARMLYNMPKNGDPLGLEHERIIQVLHDKICWEDIDNGGQSKPFYPER